MTDPYEQRLLREAQTGDSDAYEELQLLLEPDIRRFVRRLINHIETEQDIMQDVFIAFYRNLHKIDPPQQLRPYLFRIARNRCYDDLRRMGRTSTVSLDDEPVQVRVSYTQAHHQPKPDDVAHWLLLYLEVQDAMDRLPESQRQTLILYSEEGMAYAEIADVMDVSIGTVKSRLYYAKKNLRGFLRPETAALLDDEFSDDEPRRRSARPIDRTNESDQQERQEQQEEQEAQSNERYQQQPAQ